MRQRYHPLFVIFIIVIVCIVIGSGYNTRTSDEDSTVNILVKDSSVDIIVENSSDVTVTINSNDTTLDNSDTDDTLNHIDTEPMVDLSFDIGVILEILVEIWISNQK